MFYVILGNFGGKDFNSNSVGFTNTGKTEGVIGRCALYHDHILTNFMSCVWIICLNQLQRSEKRGRFLNVLTPAHSVLDSGSWSGLNVSQSRLQVSTGCSEAHKTCSRRNIIVRLRMKNLMATNNFMFICSDCLLILKEKWQQRIFLFWGILSFTFHFLYIHNALLITVD